MEKKMNLKCKHDKEKNTLEVELEIPLRQKKKEKYLSGDIIKIVEEKNCCKVVDILLNCTVCNETEEQRKGKWIFQLYPIVQEKKEKPVETLTQQLFDKEEKQEAKIKKTKKEK